MVADTIEAIRGEIGVKCDSIAEIIAKNDSDIAMLKCEIKRLNECVDHLESSNEHLKDGLADYLKHQHTTKIKTTFHSFSICKNGGKQPIEVTANVLDIPQEYCTFTPKPNMDTIRKALESGQNLEFAYLKERGEHLRIK
jgi:hypothetical protein